MSCIAVSRIVKREPVKTGRRFLDPEGKREVEPWMFSGSMRNPEYETAPYEEVKEFHDKPEEENS